MRCAPTVSPGQLSTLSPKSRCRPASPRGRWKRLHHPHTAAFAERMWERIMLIDENLQRHPAGEPLLWTVEKQSG